MPPIDPTPTGSLRTLSRRLARPLPLAAITAGTVLAVSGAAIGSTMLAREGSGTAEHPGTPVVTATPRPHPGWHTVPAGNLICGAGPASGGVTGTLEAVAATGPGDAWAVGQCDSAASACGQATGCQTDAPDATTGIVERWDGRRWNLVRVPPATGYGSVAALSDHDVWIGGTGGGGGAVVHWDGRSWSAASQGLPVSKDGGTPAFTVTAWAPSTGSPGSTGSPAAARVPAVATSPDIWGLAGKALHRWDGTAWRPVELPAGWYVSGPDPASQILAGPAGDLWISNLTDQKDQDEVHGVQRFTTAHYAGGHWSLPPTPPPYTVTRMVVAGDGVWAAMTDRPSGGARADLLLARWNGRRWSRQKPSALLAQDEVVRDLIGDGRAGMWVLTDTAESSALRHWDGHRWTVSRLSHRLHERAATVSALGSVPGTSTVWGVGEFGRGDEPGHGRPFIETTDAAP